MKIKDEDDEFLMAIRSKKGLKPLRAIDILLLFPDFEHGVEVIRKKYKIDPKIIKNRLISLLGDTKYQSWLKGNKIFKSMYDSPLPDDDEWFNKTGCTIEEHNEYCDKVRQFQSKLFPTINKDIGILRRKIIGKIPLSWTELILEYILYNEKPIFPAEYKRPYPKISHRMDYQNYEPYIEIRLFSDTDLNIINKKYLKELVSELPSSFELDKLTSENLHRRWLYYLARKKHKLKASDANEILEYLDFKPIEYEHSSQELIDRFEKLLKK
jgi:hypothetical protein